ncbi:MAG TPA: Uma2 family endonuclease, partial [Pirellulales bacterium]
MHLFIPARLNEAAPDDFYPDSDGRPVGETPAHFRNASHVKEALEAHFSGDPEIFVAANMFVYYVPGDRLKHVSPDLFLVRGIDKTKPRRRYLLWKEGKGPELVIELTSESTRDEDIDKKWIYREFLGVKEYILFDPFDEYLQPRLQGFLLQRGDDVPMPVESGRLVSEVLGLHLEPDGEDLRLYDPALRRRLRNPSEEREFAAEMAAKFNQAAVERDRAAVERDRAAVERDQAAVERDHVAVERDRALADKARLEQELAE